MSKVCMITGASRGIGKALAEQMAKKGYVLALTGRSLESIREVRDGIVASLPSAHVEVAALDVTDYDQVFEVFEQFKQSLGNIDIVVANAGISTSKPVGVGAFEQHKSVIETNVLGLMATAEACIPYFKEQDCGQFVAISSIAGLRGLSKNSSYCASKSAVKTYMESLSAELYGTNIKTTTLFPGFIDTEINQHLADRPFLVSLEQGVKEILQLIEKQVKTSSVPRKPWSLVASIIGKIPESVISRI